MYREIPVMNFNIDEYLAKQNCNKINNFALEYNKGNLDNNYYLYNFESIFFS